MVHWRSDDLSSDGLCSTEATSIRSSVLHLFGVIRPLHNEINGRMGNNDISEYYVAMECLEDSQGHQRRSRWIPGECFCRRFASSFLSRRAAGNAESASTFENAVTVCSVMDIAWCYTDKQYRIMEHRRALKEKQLLYDIYFDEGAFMTFLLSSIPYLNCQPAETMERYLLTTAR